MNGLDGRDAFGFSLTQLRAFVTVAETLSYVAAATQLGYTEPAVHHQVKRLESALGCALLVRSGRAVALTADGERILPQCATILREAERLAPLAEKRRLPGVLSISGGRLTSAYVLPEVLAEVRQRDPSLQIELVARSREHVVEDVRAGDADIGISASLDRVANPDEFIITRWRRTEFQLFESPTHRPPAETTIFAVGMTTALNSAVASLAALGIPTRVTLVQTADAAKQMCMAGLGAGFIRRECVSLEVAAGLIRPHHAFSTPIEAAIWAIQSRLRPAHEAAARFLGLTAATTTATGVGSA